MAVTNGRRSPAPPKVRPTVPPPDLLGRVIGMCGGVTCQGLADTLAEECEAIARGAADLTAGECRALLGTLLACLDLLGVPPAHTDPKPRPKRRTTR